MTAPQPTLGAFLAFVRNIMAITAQNLPDNSPWLPRALAIAMMNVNPQLRIVCIPQFDAAGAALNTGGFTAYDEAVYNYAGDVLVNVVQDQPGRKFFTALRKKLDINGFASGLVSGAADETTSVSIVVQEAAQHFTLADVQRLKTPWGRAYLAIAQSAGPTTWGIS